MQELKDRLSRVADLNGAAAVLEWDQETFMPPGGNEARSRQTATLRRLAHEMLTDERTGDLLIKAQPVDPLEEDLVRVARRDFERASRLPGDLVADFARSVGRAKHAWAKARKTNTFATFEPHLAHLIELNQRKSQALALGVDPYDALLDEFEPGAKTAEVATVFADLRRELVPIAAEIARARPVSDAVLHRFYPHDRQWAFGLQIMREIGYDFDRGRQDLSAHPFTTTLALGDVRVTTRVDEHHFSPAFFGSLHEAGHGMYEQGIAPVLDGTLLAEGTSLGIHESQSRLWENLVGRSPAFWSYAFPIAQDYFPAALDGVTESAFYGAVNAVEPSLVRVEADEVTYNLHIMLRFELEQEMLSGELAVADLPDAWNARMKAYLGIEPETDADGCLQDIHWSLGTIGYFPTYALGNLMASQLWVAAGKDLPDLDGQIGRGEFEPLLGWLRAQVHHHGRRHSATRILKDTTGGGLSAEPWLDYIRTKYVALYNL